MEKPDTFSQRWGQRFSCAGRGLVHVLRHEPSGRVHGVALIVMTGLGVWLGIAPVEWAVLLLAAGGVIAAEALNTAIERLADRVSTEREEAIRLVKDVAAGGVLAATFGAVAAGLAILGPPLWRLIFR
jgi:diacylglycerol kinase